ncbi:carbohydrate kinase [Parapedobacter pyrenivorans]|uniref:Carbohydrate kinase n=1 Tax=Parapedobacter pyrenivorans TaxID=1305674 RepID=A0A917I2F3_9SPHI|nr:FGGY family carbohydrate kinase [Parapedobacter pyrenivorans]GGH05344.1 carbohydrate kinase [Parapedobacter pyrenivorans]
MLLLGIDIGTSSIKVSVVDADTQACVASVRYPDDHENNILSVIPTWAEQAPDMWWEQVVLAIRQLTADASFKTQDIGAIGIAYQMHGLVVVDKDGNALRNSIIWCDSRAVDIGEAAFTQIGKEYALEHLLNSPGNFTASKWAWVKANEPDTYAAAHHIMLPGDYIALKLTGTATTSISALSEGVFWDFKTNGISKDVINYFGFDEAIFPEIRPLFGEHGTLRKDVAVQLGLRPGIPISYKAGDQPNNALSLNVLQPGEVAATAGTSGVIYAVSDQLIYDQASRVNTFAHVNYTPEEPRTGVLLCINGTGILNRWVKDHFGHGIAYPQMNALGKAVSPGSNGLKILPFGNGAERILHNKILGARFIDLDFNAHGRSHVFRASQEGIAFSFRYGLDIIRENGMSPAIIRAGQANMFLSELFTEIFVDVTGVPVELHENDGSVGAALGAGIGAGIFASASEAFSRQKALTIVEPQGTDHYEALYQEWKQLLEDQLAKELDTTGRENNE